MTVWISYGYKDEELSIFVFKVPE